MPPKRRRTVEFDLFRPIGQCTLCAAQHKFDELPILFRSTDAHKAHSQKFQCRFDLNQCSGRVCCTDITQCPKSEQLIGTSVHPVGAQRKRFSDRVEHTAQRPHACRGQGFAYQLTRLIALRRAVKLMRRWRVSHEVSHGRLGGVTRRPMARHTADYAALIRPTIAGMGETEIEA